MWPSFISYGSGCGASNGLDHRGGGRRLATADAAVLAPRSTLAGQRRRRHLAPPLSQEHLGGSVAATTHTGNGDNDDRDQYIRELVDAAPPLTAAQIATLRTLFDYEPPPEPPTG